MRSLTDPSLLERIRRAARQEQFLDVVPAEVATARFHAAIDLAPLPAEAVPLAAALGRVVAVPVAAAADAPPFDRASMDGFALRAADTLGATEAAPRRLRLNAELLACGVAPGIAVAPGTATAIATGGVIPRGADAVVMVEQTEAEEGPEGPVVLVRRPAVAGQAVAYAGSDIARGETVLRAGTLVTSREIGMLAAAGLATVPVVRRPRVAILSTGDELVAPGQPLPTGGIYDSNAAILAAAVAEHGGEPVPMGIFRDDEATLEAALRRALEQADLVVMSGGTSKGAGDVSHRILSRLPPPGVLVHGVALKPGKPLCLGAVGRTAGGGAAGLPDQRRLHLPGIRRAGDPRPGRPAGAGGGGSRGPPRGPHPERGRPHRIRHGLPGRGRRRAVSPPGRSARAPAASPPSPRRMASSPSTRRNRAPPPGRPCRSG